MQARKRNLSATKNKNRSVEKTFTDLALLVEISQFLEDRELFSFIIVNSKKKSSFVDLYRSQKELIL